jgi:hypothetical protein
MLLRMTVRRTHRHIREKRGSSTGPEHPYGDRPTRRVSQESKDCSRGSEGLSGWTTKITKQGDQFKKTAFEKGKAEGPATDAKKME